MENSVEFSTKENKAKEAEKEYKEKVQQFWGYTDDSPIQSLGGPYIHKKDHKEN